jgi:hypothetical protein
MTFGKIGIVVLVLAVGAAAVPSAGDAAPGDDAYIEGYAAALLEREFKLTTPSLRVQHGVITVSAADLAGVDRARVVAALERIRGVARVEVVEPGARPSVGASPTAPEPSRPAESRPLRILRQLESGLLPGGQLFNPLIADPRWPHFAASQQYYLNDPQLKNVGAVSFGETFTVYRDHIGSGWWEIGVQAGVFSIFDLDAPSKDLINTDFLVAAVAGYRYQDLSALFRVFHQSSHLGDEFLLRSRVRNRVNLSYEAVDLRLSYDFGEVLRVYGGGGYLFDQDPSNLRPGFTQVGAELRSPWPDPAAGWRPVAAVDIQNREQNDWHADFSLRAGVQFEGLLVTRNFRLLLEYFRGHSPNGQFYRHKIDYIGLGAHVHF